MNRQPPGPLRREPVVWWEHSSCRARGRACGWVVRLFPTGQLLSFDIGDQPVFEIPLSNVSQCTTGKNEVTLEFHQNDDAEVSLMEVRFYVPPTQEDGVDPVEVRPPALLSGPGQPVAGSLRLSDPRVPRQAFAQNVLSKADVIQATGDAICIFRELQCLTPRGRYDIRIYPTFLHLHGKTFDYKIPYTTVLRLFLLPHKDQRQMFFVVSRNPRAWGPPGSLGGVCHPCPSSSLAGPTLAGAEPGRSFPCRSAWTPLSSRARPATTSSSSSSRRTRTSL